MDDAIQPGQLSKTFADKAGDAITNYVFSWHFASHVAIMGLTMGTLGLMALPAGAATIGDLGLATIDGLWAMIEAPFAGAERLGDVFANTAAGDFGASYEMGTMADMHAGHGGEALAHAGDHTGHCGSEQFDEFITGVDPSNFEAMQTMLDPGQSMFDFWAESGLCHG